MSVSFFSWASPRLGHSCVLGAINFSAVEVCGHRINAFLVHIILVYFNWVPIVKVISTIVSLETIDVSIRDHWSCVHHLWVYSDVWIFLSPEALRFSSLSLDSWLNSFYTYSWNWSSTCRGATRNSWHSCSYHFIPASQFFLHILIFSRKFINLNIFLLISLVWSF